jgi:hypothetical protein
VGEGDGCVSGADAAGVLGEGSVADPEEAVLDLPVIAGEPEQAALVHHIGWDGCDGVDDLARAHRPGLAQPLDPDDARGARPDLVEPCGQLAHADAPGLDAAVAAVDLLGAAQIGRIDRSVSLPGAAGEP